MAAKMENTPRILFGQTFFLLVVAGLILGACKQAPPNLETVEPSPQPVETQIPSPTPEPPDNILFVGQSWTSAHQGFYTHLEGLTASASPPLTIKTSSIIKMGAPLEVFWDTVVNKINKERFDYVVLHEIARNVLSEDGGAEIFLENFRKYNDDIINAGAQTILIMNWEVGSKTDIAYEKIVQETSSVGNELNIKIAPVGLAWKRAQVERPDYELLDSDLLHSNIRGTYLATLVIYATIYEQNPIGLTYQPAHLIAGVESLEYKHEEWLMTDEEVEFLQRIAWETVTEYHNINE